MKKLNVILTKTGEDEYLAQDNLIHCKRCRMPRQLQLNFGDHSHTVRCLCVCQQAKLNGQQERLHRREEMDRIARIRSVAMAEPALRKCTFAASEYDSPGLQIAHNYANHWCEFAEAGSGLLFWGPPGTGKTYLATCISNALLDQGVPVLMTSFGRMLGALPDPASGEQTAMIDEWMRHPLLIIDDLGVERESQYALELVYHIIDARYRNGRPMVITTNLSMEELEKTDSLQKMRIYQRVLERCTPVQMNGESIREKKRKENRDLARKYLK